MKKIFLYLLIISSSALAQNTTIIRGRVINKQNGSAIPNASVFIKNKFYGTATNPEGFFSLYIKKSQNNDSITISCIGFIANTIPVSYFKTNSVILIKLEPKTILLDDIMVIPEESADKFLKNAFDSLLIKLRNKPFEIDGFYKEEIIVNGKYNGFAEAILKGHSEGYNLVFANKKYRYFPPGWFKVNNCRVSDFLIDYDDSGMPRTTIGINKILFYDHYFITRSLLLKRWRKKQIFKYKAINYSNGQNVLVFHFEPKNKNKSHQSGKIFLSADDNSLIKIEFYINNPKIVVKPMTLYSKKILYDTISILFTKVKGKSYLTNLIRKYKYISYKWDTLAKPDTILEREQFLVTKIYPVVYSDEKLKKIYDCDIGRFDDVRYRNCEFELPKKDFDYDTSFWNNCNLCYGFDSEVMKKISNDLGNDKKLIEQFKSNRGNIHISKNKLINLFNKYNKKDKNYGKVYRAYILN